MDRILRCTLLTIAALLVDDVLDRLSIMSNGLVCPIHVGILQYFFVETPHGIRVLHLADVLRRCRRQRLLQFPRGVVRQFGLAEEELRGVGVRHAQSGGEIVVGEAGFGLGIQETFRPFGDVDGRNAAVTTTTGSVACCRWKWSSDCGRREKMTTLTLVYYGVVAMEDP